jgi:hypothetical protein
MEKEKNGTKYIDSHWENPTSAVVERLFSLLKRVYTPSRRAIEPDNVERVLFLQVNKSFWDLDDIVQLYGKISL